MGSVRTGKTFTPGAIKARDRLASRQKVYLIELLQVIKDD